jgi:hypothetical protein
VRNFGIPQRSTRDDAGDDEGAGIAASFCAFFGVLGGLLLCAVTVLGLSLVMRPPPSLGAVMLILAVALGGPAVLAAFAALQTKGGL